jgi:cell division protein FtsL
MQWLWKSLSIGLLFALFFSALNLLEVRHQIRQQFTELQSLQQQRDAMNIEWGQLQLEQSTWVQHQRLESTAQGRLNMHYPNYGEMQILKP